MSSRLFSVKDYATSMERVYKKMFERFNDGQQPEHILNEHLLDN
jgi:hypothetical protein